MRADVSRIRLSRGKGYTAVLEQQGRVALDADANEQRFLDQRLRRTETVDVIGEFGGPAGDEGFSIDVSTGDMVIGAGRYYVAGLLCENPSAVTYEGQQFLKVPAGTGAGLLGQLPGRLLDQRTILQVSLQAWQRLVTALDDPCLREPALGGADTTARLQTVWRVVANPVSVNLTQTPGSFCPVMYQNQPTPSTGTLTVTPSGAAADCGCGPVAAAGYQGIENQLYRVEIHTGGDASTATFKWSRENGSVVAAVTSISGATAVVNSLGPDANLCFQVGQWVELTDDTVTYGDIANKAGALYQIQSIDKEAPSVTLAPSVTGIDPSQNARIRRWDQSGPAAGTAGVPLSPGTPIELENGIQVTFGPGTYQPGDYWTLPARTATGMVEWPPCDSDGNPAQPPTSIVVHEAPLACLYWVEDSPASGEAVAEFEQAAIGPAPSPFPQPTPVPRGHVVTEDCRLAFRPLTPAPAIHVESVNWANDDAMPIDVLVKNGLLVKLDQDLVGPVNGGNFIVTTEAPVGLKPVLSAALQRTISVFDAPIVHDGGALRWQLLPDDPAVATINDMIPVHEEEVTPLLLPRVRVRLIGQAFMATGASGPIYLNGRAFGQHGTRGIDGSDRIDLRFPSGDGPTASDFESWFYLAPVLQIKGLTIPNNGDYTAVGFGTNFAGVVPSNTTGATPVTKVDATATLSYHAAVATTLSVTISDSTYASVPTAVTINQGDISVPVPITISGTPTPGSNLAGFQINATVNPAAESPYLPQSITQQASFTLRPPTAQTQ
jgi:Family of unknown function (DUF6519)